MRRRREGASVNHVVAVDLFEAIGDILSTLRTLLSQHWGKNEEEKKNLFVSCRRNSIIDKEEIFHLFKRNSIGNVKDTLDKD